MEEEKVLEDVLNENAGIAPLEAAEGDMEMEEMREAEGVGDAAVSDTEGETETAAEAAVEPAEEPARGRRLEIEGLREVVALIREAEEKGYARGREAEKAEQKLKMLAELERTRNMWHNEVLAAAEREAEEKEALGEEFLSRIKPSVWD